MTTPTPSIESSLAQISAQLTYNSTKLIEANEKIASISTGCIALEAKVDGIRADTDTAKKVAEEARGEVEVVRELAVANKEAANLDRSRLLSLHKQLLDMKQRKYKK